MDLAGPADDGLEISSACMAAMRGRDLYSLDLVQVWEAEQKS